MLKQVRNLRPNSFTRYSHSRQFDFAVPPKTNQLHKFIGFLKLSDNNFLVEFDKTTVHQTEIDKP